MTRLEKQLAAINIDLRQFLTDAANTGKTQYWCAEQLLIGQKTVSDYIKKYGIPWRSSREELFNRHAFEWRGERNTITGHCKRIGITLKQAEGRRYRHGHEWREVLEYYAKRA